jgi:copper homeostasis protein
MKLEICVFSITDAIIAMEGGADRIELCASYVEGGITPSYATILETFEFVDPENIVIMLRPRGGNFIYNEYELDVMRREIVFLKEIGTKNIIFGILDANGNLDYEKNASLVALASPMHCTLQRAFDLADDPYDALHTAIQCGFKRILTSGQKPSAIEGKDLIKELISIAANKIDILPGSGINSKNAKALIDYTGCTEIHGSAKMYIQPDVAGSSYQYRKDIYDFRYQTAVNMNEVCALKEIMNSYI